MTGITEIRKQNCQNKADLEHSRDGTYCVLRDGSILIRNGTRSKTIDSGIAAHDFITKVKDKTAGQVKVIVQSYF